MDSCDSGFHEWEVEDIKPKGEDGLGEYGKFKEICVKCGIKNTYYDYIHDCEILWTGSVVLKTKKRLKPFNKLLRSRYAGYHYV